MLTLGQAARQCGVSKGTISKAIKSGKLSATRCEDGSWSIDNAELARYVGANGHRFRSETGNVGVAGERVETGAEISPAMTALVAELNRVIVDLRADRDAWREQAQRLTLPARKPDEKPAEKPMTWWRWRTTS
jgi:excisionase family DNA binding protein